MTPQYRFDVEFHEESNDALHGIVQNCAKKRLYKKPRKNRKKHENSGKFEKIQHFSELLQVFFHMKKLKI